MATSQFVRLPVLTGEEREGKKPRIKAPAASSYTNQELKKCKK